MNKIKIQKAELVVIVTAIILTVIFQNCSKVNFNKSTSSSIEIQSTPIPSATPSPTPTPSPSPTPPQCPPGQAWIDGECRPTSFTECNVFIELDTAVSPTVIPPLETTGLCYYKKILNAVPVHASGTNGEERAIDVLSRDHSSSSWQPINPFIMGEATFNFIFQGNRTVSLSSNGSADVTQGQMAIDNYFLVETLNQNNVKHMLARGTADARPYINSNKEIGPILVNGEPVNDFISYAAGGTAMVGYIDISSGFEINDPTNLKVRQLDCGGSAQATDVYIIIH